LLAHRLFPRLLANRCYQFRPNQAVPDENVVKRIPRM
jgi:hypothetical protein